jgi:ferritin-like metal-binding protein YciE
MTQLADTSRALLVLALQDLHDGERAWVDQLPGIAERIVDDRFAAAVQSEIGQGRERAGRLQAIATALRVDIAGAENIWLRAILEDAHRDTTMIEQGPLLDIALIGAFRKGVQADRVSYETAVALAHSLGLDDAERALTTSRDQLAGTDETLAGLLREIAA